MVAAMLGGHDESHGQFSSSERGVSGACQGDGSLDTLFMLGRCQENRPPDTLVVVRRTVPLTIKP